MKFWNELPFLRCFQGVITDEGKSFGCLTSAYNGAAALTSTMTCSARQLHVGSWRPVSSKRGPFTASRPGPVLAWYLVTLITTHLMASSITSKELAPTCWLGRAGRWQGCLSSVWRPKMKTVGLPLFPGSKMSQWRCMVTESCYPKAVLEQSR